MYFGGIPTTIAHADPAVAALDPIPPTTPDIPPRTGTPVVGPSGFRSSSDLDGFYLWLGPSAAATETGGDWDSAFGGDLAASRIREGALLGAVGADLGFSKYTAHVGGRLWLDGLAGTRAFGHTMVGVTAGPVFEIADYEHVRAGASVGAWAFVGVTPYVRLGAVSQSGTFVEIGMRIALPVFRR